MRCIFECPSIHRWAKLGYYTHLHLAVSKWNNTYNRNASVRMGNEVDTVYVDLTELDSIVWSMTWNSEHPQLTNYTTVAV